jgi:nucleoside recognition membrane protein YjiH
MNTVDWIGFVGVFQILLAYVLNIFGKLEKKDLTFILLNLIGASLACVASILMKYMPFIILEGAWALVSLIALLKYIKAN